MINNTNKLLLETERDSHLVFQIHGLGSNQNKSYKILL